MRVMAIVRAVESVACSPLIVSAGRGLSASSALKAVAGRRFAGGSV